MQKNLMQGKIIERRRKETREEIDSILGTGFKGNECKMMEEVETVKTYVKGNYEGGQNPSGAVEPRKRRSE